MNPDSPKTFSTKSILNRAANLSAPPPSILKPLDGPPKPRPLPAGIPPEHEENENAPPPPPQSEVWDEDPELSEAEDDRPHTPPAPPPPPTVATPPAVATPAQAAPAKTPAPRRPTGVTTVMDAFKAMAEILENVADLKEVRLAIAMAVAENANTQIIKSRAATIRIRTPFVEVSDEAFGMLFDQRDLSLEICNGAEVEILFDGKLYTGVSMARQMTFPGTSWVFISFVLIGDAPQGRVD